MEPKGLPYGSSGPSAGAQPPKLPIETFKDFYVTRFGGFSEELTSGQVGIDVIALQLNTRLREAAEVLLMKMHAATRVPLHLRRIFYVVPIDDTMPTAFAQSRNGHVVLPPWDALEGDWSEHRDLVEGDEIIINGALGKWKLPENLLRRVAMGG